MIKSHSSVPKTICIPIYDEKGRKKGMAWGGGCGARKSEY